MIIKAGCARQFLSSETVHSYSPRVSVNTWLKHREDIFIYDDPATGHRSINRLTCGSDAPTPAVNMDAPGCMSTQYKLPNEEITHHRCQDMTYRQWGRFLSQAMSGDMLTDEDGQFIYGWVPRGALEGFSVPALPEDGVEMDSTALVVSTIMKQPMKVLYDGVALFVPVKGLKEYAMSPRFLTHAFGTVGGLTVLHMCLPGVVFWGMTNIVVSSTIGTVVSVSVNVAYKAADTLLGLAAAVTKEIAEAVYDGLKVITFPALNRGRKTNGNGERILDKESISIQDPRSDDDTNTEYFSISESTNGSLSYEFGGFSFEAMKLRGRKRGRPTDDSTLSGDTFDDGGVLVEVCEPGDSLDDCVLVKKFKL